MPKSRVSVTVHGKHGKVHAIIGHHEHVVWRIYALIFPRFSFLYRLYFIKEIENIFPRALIRYIKTRGNLEELEITRNPAAISRSPKPPLVFL